MEMESFEYSCEYLLDSAHPSQATLPGFASIVERLRSSGEFTPEQIQRIESELTRFFDRVDLSFEGRLSEPSLIGEQIGGYKLVGLLGEGGSGRVFRARCADDPNSFVALKRIKQVKSSSRFRREMDLVQRLAHPNVIVAYEVGEHRDTLFIVMEELSGPDLHQLVKASGPIAWQDSVALLIDAASGLEHAHQRGLVHRDVKPGNLMFDGDRIKVTDLGLAVLSEAWELPSSQSEFRTHCEVLGGTTDFMAPEQARSLNAANAQSDIYSLGATWFYLLTGQTRVQGNTLREKVVNLIQGEQLRELPESVAPPEVRAVFDRMLAYQPGDRYESMTATKEALLSLQRSLSTVTLKNSIDVMIVEDDQDDLLLTIEMLQRGNNAVNVVAYNTLRDAIASVDLTNRSVAENDPDLVLLDLQLPDSQGVETVRRFLRCNPDVPVIVLTGHDDQHVGEACIVAGADDFACKNDLTPHLLERMIFVTLSRFVRRSNG